MSQWLVLFLGLRVAQFAVETWLASLNSRAQNNAVLGDQAARQLGISTEDLSKSLAYANDIYGLNRWENWISMALTLAFLSSGGLGVVESAAQALTGRTTGVVAGLAFFAVLGLLSYVVQVPFAYYRTFAVEEKHGFNRQTRMGFWIDAVKGLALGAALGGGVLALLLSILNQALTQGPNGTGIWSAWWVWAWLVVSGFSLFVAWIYPSVLAPLFNKFQPLADQDLRSRIDALSSKVGFRSSGVFVMDASRRTNHGNAYFAGMFGAKRIVLFDTLLKSLSPAGIVSVLAHELGHFRLNHVRWTVVRGTIMTGFMFWAASLALHFRPIYEAFGLVGPTAHGALVMFGLWLGPVMFLLSPIGSMWSRRYEFAADRFAAQTVGGVTDLGDALLKLREASRSMPVVHPWFSAVYYSHPPLLERLSAMGYFEANSTH